MRKYVQLGNNSIGQGPYLHRGVTLHSFALQGDLQRIQRCLDRMFAEPSGGQIKYQAITSKVFVSFANIEAVSSVPDADHGSVSEIDVSFWVLALAHELSLSIVRWIPMYLFVDSGPAMAAGREVFGFPKQLARFTIPPGAPSMTRFDVETIVIPKFEPAQKAGWAKVLEIEPLAAAAGANAPAMWPDIATAERAFFAEFVTDRGGAAPVASIETSGLQTKVRMAFLKQFPDVGSTQDACYQAIAEASATVDKFRFGGFTSGGFRANLTSFASHPFDRELGIAPGWRDVGRAMWIDYDFLMHMGKTRWIG